MIKVRLIGPDEKEERWIKSALHDSREFMLLDSWRSPQKSYLDDHVKAADVYIIFINELQSENWNEDCLYRLFIACKKPFIIFYSAGKKELLDRLEPHIPVTYSDTRDIIFNSGFRDLIKSQIQISGFISPTIISDYVKKIKIDRPVPEVFEAEEKPNKVILIGSSTGGPKVVQQIISDCGTTLLGKRVVIAQHMSHQFLNDFRDVLKSKSGLPVEIIEENQRFEGGTVFLAPVRRQIILGANNTFVYDPNRHLYPFMPDINVIFKSIINEYKDQVLLIILSGLGHDGLMAAQLTTYYGGVVAVQAPNSAELPSMPQAIIDNGHHHFSFQPDEFGDFIKHVFLNHTEQMNG